MAQYCHFLAARTCPQLLDQLLVAVLAAAELNSILLKPVADPDFPKYGKAGISGNSHGPL